jgi:acyl-CoA dehydrogenase
MATLDFTRPGTAIGAVGVAQAAYEHAVEYAKERVDLRPPDRDAPGDRLHDRRHGDRDPGLASPLLAGRVDARPGHGRDATLYSSFAKRFAADTAMKVTTDAVQVLGGYGYIKEYPVEKLMRDAKLFQIYEGTSQIQRLVIAREIFTPKG